jgi:glycosyltransferase involved in cell wall biosynthesis
LDLSIAIATRNRAKALHMTLHSLARVDDAGVDWELVIVDNGSTDGTPEVASAFAPLLPSKYVYEPRLGKSNALNRVAGELAGRLVCFADDDILYPPHWMKSMLAAAEEYPGFGVFGGPVSPFWTRSSRQAHLQHPFCLEAHAIRNLGSRAIEYPNGVWPVGANTMYRRELLDAEPFNPHLGPVGNTRLIGNDTALAKQLVDRGVRLLYVPGADVRHIIQPEQMVPTFLWRRAYQRARTLALSGPIAPCRSVAGVPLWMIRKLARRASRLPTAWLGLGGCSRIGVEIDLADILGWIAGTAESRRQGRAGT